MQRPAKSAASSFGQSGLKQTDLNLLLSFYGITGELAESMREMAKAGRQRGRWRGHRNAIPDWFRQYVDLEADAREIKWYQAEVVPGILQTEPYIQAMNAGPTTRSSEDEAERQAQIQVRLERQAILDRTDSPDLAFILSESALRRTIGDTATMRDQLNHLAEVSKRPNVDLQILPFNAATYATSSFSFIILRFGDDFGSDVIYVEDYTNADYLDDPEQVRSYTRLWNRLSAAALGPVESRRMIARLATELGRD